MSSSQCHTKTRKMSEFICFTEAKNSIEAWLYDNFKYQMASPTKVNKIEKVIFKNRNVPFNSFQFFSFKNKINLFEEHVTKIDICLLLLLTSLFILECDISFCVS